MPVWTFTVNIGTLKCTNNCPICISKMTPTHGMSGCYKPKWDAFVHATEVAVKENAKIFLMTGKGEPLLYPDQITRYLLRLQPYNHHFIRRELQTSGFQIWSGGVDKFLDIWRDLRLDLIAISIYHHEDAKNKTIFNPTSGMWMILNDVINKLTNKGFKVRLSCVLLNDYIDSIDEVNNLIYFAKKKHIFQLTLRRASIPRNPREDMIAENVRKMAISDEKFNRIAAYIDKQGVKCDELPHGASVYDVNGQNVCITTGLTSEIASKDKRQLIFFGNTGTLTNNWEYPNGGALL